MHDAREEIKRKLAHASEDFHRAETGLAHAAEDIEHEVGRRASDAGNQFRHAVGMDESTSRQSRPGTAGTAETDTNPEEEEGWMSDREVETGSITSKKHKSKSKSPKHSGSRAVGAPSGSRRRQSFRRGVLANVRNGGRSASDGQIIVYPAAEDEDSEDHRGRRSTPRGEGRSSTPVIPTLLTPSSPRSVRHRRIDSLRSLRPGSRELSPARSIRWADEQDIPDGLRSGTMTPKMSSPSTPLPGSEAPSDNEEVIVPTKADDSPTSATQVRFDIPPTKER